MNPSKPALLALWLSGAAVLAACADESATENAPEPGCSDGIRNAGETDVDCGGPCGGCLVGKDCGGDADCLGQLCIEGVCALPACDDRRKNGEETDVDCGGGDCPACAAGLSCVLAADCASGLCEGGTCAVPPSCTDGEKNGAETDVDCGGGTCPVCALDQACAEDRDCRSAACDGGICVPSCTNLQLDGDESDVDCGGSCDGCPDGKSCRENADCLNETCNQGGLCESPPVVAPCENGVRDGVETDVDCGGGECPKCPWGYGCEDLEDCEPGMTGVQCEDGICGGRLACDDLEMDGHETDVDCGGPFCRACAGGKGCATGTDCLSGECVNDTCTPTPDTCANETFDGFETDIDCGGPCPPCPDGWGCEWSLDCDGEWCEDGVCGGPWICEDGSQNGKESDLDCGGPFCPPCAEGKQCREDADCETGSCVDWTCAPAAAARHSPAPRWWLESLRGGTP